jgi:ankyrin repeat protein
VGALLASGSSVNEADKNGTTPLCAACSEGHESTAELLLQQQPDHLGASVLAGRHERGRAAVVGLIEIGSLIDQGANPHQADNCGVTPLVLASQKGHVEVIRELPAA